MYMNPAKISDNQKIKAEWNLFRMFIGCALPWALMDNRFFTDFIHVLAPNFSVPDRSSFFPKHLAQEVAVWGEKFKEFLEGRFHLTMSLDGWSTRARDEIYTVHTTTPKRRSFFTDGHIFKGISVTGEALKDVLVRVRTSFIIRNNALLSNFDSILQLLVTYEPSKYSAIAGDGGSNVRSAKIKINSHFPWILNIYDPCHNLNLFMKDLGKLFKDVSSFIRH